MVDATKFAIRAWYDESKGLLVEIYYKFLNGITYKDIKSGSDLKIGEFSYNITSWEPSKETGNPVFLLKGLRPAVTHINEAIKKYNG